MPTLGQVLFFVFYDIKTDSYVPKGGKVIGIKGTKVQVEGLKRWHETAAHPPAFESEAECVAWIAAHRFKAPEIK